MRALLAVLILTGLATTYAHNHIELVQRTHPLDGHNLGYILIRGIPLPGWGGDRLQPALSWRCIGDKDFNLYQWLDVEDSSTWEEHPDHAWRPERIPLTSLRYRFDKNETSGKQQWRVMDSYLTHWDSYAGPKEKIKFTKTAIDNKAIVLFERLTKKGYQFLEFDLIGLKNKIEQLSCVDLTDD